MKRRLLPPLPCPALVLPGAAALALFLAGCPHPVGWSGEIPLESSSTSPSPVPKEPLSWAEAVNHMNNNPFQQGEIVYELSGSEEEGSPAPPLFYGSAGNCPEKILIKGGGKKLILRYPGPLLTVGPGVEMTLENITLRGMGGNNAPLVLVDGGILRIGEGVIIEKNKNEASEEEGLGGGVTVRGGGTFFMSGGEIRENYAAVYGGGLYVEDGAAYLSGGLISYNRAGAGGGVAIGWSSNYISQGTVELSGGAVIERNTVFGVSGWTNGSLSDRVRGGGVYLISGTFDMSGGEIRRNTVPVSGEGSGVYLSRHGDFTMSGGTIWGNIGGIGAGVCLDESSFITMSGSARVAPDNTVFFDAPNCSILLKGPLTADHAACLDGRYPGNYGNPILTGDLSAGSPPNYTRFTVETGSINPDGTWSL